MSNDRTSNAYVNDEIATARMAVVAQRTGGAPPRRTELQRLGGSPPFELRLELSLYSESNFYIGFTQNFSDGGVFVATHALQRLGATCDLIIMLPNQNPITTKGTVRWIRPYSEGGDTPPGMGIRFDQLPAADAALIREFADARQPIFFDDEELNQ